MHLKRSHPRHLGEVLKGLLGRARPFVSTDTNPSDFKLLKGFSTSNRQSFPSGHTTTAFAVA